MKTVPALILFAHGARDERWAEPFVRLQKKINEHYPGKVILAYLEIMQPSLEEAVANCVTMGCQQLVVVPIFLGQGGHIRKDLPYQVQMIRERYPTLDLKCAPTAGEDDFVIEALAQFCLHQATGK